MRHLPWLLSLQSNFEIVDAVTCDRGVQLLLQSQSCMPAMVKAVMPRLLMCRVAKEGALLVSEKTVKKGRGRKKMEQSAEAMPDIPAAEQAQPKAKGRRAATARSAPVLQGDAVTEAAPVMPAVSAPKKKGVCKTKSAKASIGKAAEAAVTGAAVKLEPSDIKEKPARQKRAPRRKTAPAAADALAAGQGDAEARLLPCKHAELRCMPCVLRRMHCPALGRGLCGGAMSVTSHVSC